MHPDMTGKIQNERIHMVASYATRGVPESSDRKTVVPGKTLYL